MGLKFEWDRRKAVANLKKHGVPFEEAATAFGGRLSVTIHDPDHSSLGEDRSYWLGKPRRKGWLWLRIPTETT
jgi:uncharacterized protein